MHLLDTSIDFFKRPKQGFKMFLKMIYYAHQSSGSYIGRNFFDSFCKAFKLYVKHGFIPEEAYQYGFLYNNIKYGSHINYTSKKKMMSIQEKVNPLSWEMLTEDKSIFYSICNNAKIPIPKVFGFVFKNLPGYSFIDNKCICRNNWEQFCLNTLPKEFLIKPARGCYGRKIKIFKRNGDIFIDELNAELQPGLVYDFMVKDPTYDCFIIQERLTNHHQLSELSNTRALQTIRVITHVDKRGECRVIYAYLKPIVGNNIVDNQNYGRTGNLLAKVDLVNGTLQSAIYMASNPYGIKTITHHPDTGIRFNGFPIPDWNGVCELAILTAKQFVPIRAIGWDIGITPNGPYVIEGNITWDPPKFGDIQNLIANIKL